MWIKNGSTMITRLYSHQVIGSIQVCDMFIHVLSGMILIISGINYLHKHNIFFSATKAPHDPSTRETCALLHSCFRNGFYHKKTLQEVTWIACKKKAIQIQEVLYVLPLNMLQLKIHLFRNFWGCLLMVLRFGNIFIYLPSLSYISQEQILMAFFAFIISSVCSFCLYSSSSSWFCSLSCLLL